ncbi:hypothetical protein AB0K51_17365 [Kitasatospora sp. NPDC049285]|uniref:hypothetical protein n=1 Tax=Kitasatospora sp. NPDC049285 TaxID=3157096 RepID=UPI00342F8FA6
MSTEIVQLVEQAGPYLASALSAYGGAVLTRAEDAAVDASADLGQRILQAVWRRRPAAARAAIEDAVQDAAEDTDPDAAALRRQVKRALREDPELLGEIAALLPRPVPGSVTITASGSHSIAAHTIGTVITGNHNRVTPPPPAPGTGA